MNLTQRMQDKPVKVDIAARNGNKPDPIIGKVRDLLPDGFLDMALGDIQADKVRSGDTLTIPFYSPEQAISKIWVCDSDGEYHKVYENPKVLTTYNGAPVGRETIKDLRKLGEWDLENFD
jgi:hypothetical protein